MEETVQRERGEVRVDRRGTTRLMSGFEKHQQLKEAERTGRQVDRWTGGNLGGRGSRGQEQKGALCGEA